MQIRAGYVFRFRSRSFQLSEVVAYWNRNKALDVPAIEAEA